mgnify:CR=1 FL=1
MLREQLQEIVWARFAGNDVGCTNVDARAKKYVQLRAMIKGQRVQDSVVGSDFAIDDAALAKETFLRELETRVRRVRSTDRSGPELTVA